MAMKGTVCLVVSMALLTLGMGISGSRTESFQGQTLQSPSTRSIMAPPEEQKASGLNSAAAGGALKGEQEQESWALPLIRDTEGLKGSSHRVLTFVAIGFGITGAVLLIVVLVFPAAMVCLVRCLGFTAQGIVAGTSAAFIMSLYAGQVTVGSICAICQSIGALGYVVFCTCGPILVTVVALGFVSVSLLLILLHVDFKQLWASVHADFTQIWASVWDFFSSIVEKL